MIFLRHQKSIINFKGKTDFRLRQKIYQKLYTCKSNVKRISLQPISGRVKAYAISSREKQNENNTCNSVITKYWKNDIRQRK